MASVNALAYLGITGPDIDAWKTYATEVLGLQVSPSSTDEKLLLRMSEGLKILIAAYEDPSPENFKKLVSVMAFDQSFATDELAA